ncbi:hypothetical protein Ciccas_003358 [Cichlidogyrus casuarinus]|uniref:VASP tetramerisation domain-containing protein n=1 Tax=Cichlidogyrus casuarinus TaxID=1844966 RepID=A0ABD2QEL1_9PLAT
MSNSQNIHEVAVMQQQQNGTPVRSQGQYAATEGMARGSGGGISPYQSMSGVVQPGSVYQQPQSQSGYMQAPPEPPKAPPPPAQVKKGPGPPNPPPPPPPPPPAPAPATRDNSPSPPAPAESSLEAQLRAAKANKLRSVNPPPQTPSEPSTPAAGTINRTQGADMMSDLQRVLAARRKARESDDTDAGNELGPRRASLNGVPNGSMNGSTELLTRGDLESFKREMIKEIQQAKREILEVLQQQQRM